MKYFMHELYKRLVIHWNTSLIALGFIISLILWALGRITAEELSVASVAILSFYAAFSKDPNKMPTKQAHQVKDVE